MILDWLDRILARILPVHSREGGLHAREPGDVFDHSRAEEHAPIISSSFIPALFILAPSAICGREGLPG